MLVKPRAALQREAITDIRGQKYSNCLLSLQTYKSGAGVAIIPEATATKLNEAQQEEAPLNQVSYKQQVLHGDAE